MDGERFDSLTRSLAHNHSRRSMVKGLTTLVAGASIAGRPLVAKGAPNPCNAYCAGEPGARGAQCRQACKDCGGPTSAGFCHDQYNRQYLCCPSGLECFEPIVEEGVRSAICCATERQVCSTSNDDFYCCPGGEECWGWNLCCPEGTQSTCEGACCDNDDGCCFSRAAEAYICGGSCFDVCAGEWDCGEAHTDSSCTATSCYDQCTGEYRCGTPNQEGNCSVETCFDVCQSQTVCGTPNERGNCSYYYTCLDACTGNDSCDYPDGNGYCPGTACFDPAQDAFICGTSCPDFCTGQERCGSSEGNPWGYCNDTFCLTSEGNFACGTPDDDGACIE